MTNIEKLLAVARGDTPADLAIMGGQVFNSFLGTFEPRDVLIADGHIAAILPWKHPFSDNAFNRQDITDHWLTPGFIDAHVHIESSMLCPEAFCSLLAQNGVTTIIADPHEIANVLGTVGIDYMLEATEGAAARVFFMLPSCVPASPLGKAAWTLEAEDLRPYFSHPRVLGLAELMNYPGVVNGSPDTLTKILALQAYNAKHFGALRGLVMDGHAPFLSKEQLQGYVACGIHSDHEASTVEEAKERLAAGMGLMMREGSAAKNLLDLVPAVTEYTAHLCMLCTDDRHPEDIAEQGSINALIRALVQQGSLPLPTIINMASYNTARHFSLRDTGAIAPGYRADCAVYPDLQHWRPTHVWNKGVTVCKNALPAPVIPKASTTALRGRVVLKDDIGQERLAFLDMKKPVKTIDVLAGQLVTMKGQATLPAQDGFLLADPTQNIAKLAVFERHHGTGRVGVSFIRGLGLKQGAIASTVAHDSHNLVVVGMNDDDMFTAVKALQNVGGGLAVVNEGTVLGIVPLPLAGIFTDRPIAELSEQMHAIKSTAQQLLADEKADPFMTLAFMTLDVIPHIKLTDSGLVDVDAFAFTSPYAE